MTSVMGNARLIDVPRFTDSRGSLSVIEAGETCPFQIRRVFTICGCRRDDVRGRHANRYSQFFMYCPTGQCDVKVVDLDSKESLFHLDSPNVALYVPSMTWKEMSSFSEDCILLIASDTHYDKSEYIYGLAEFLSMQALGDDNQRTEA